MSTARVREIFRTSSVIEMVVTGSIIVTERETNLSVIATTKGTVISMTPTTTNLPGFAHRTEGAMKESRLSTRTWGGYASQ
jgi:hypothetical protein